MTEVQNELINWYNANHRNLPWRSTENPYYIWLSETILQQTRVDQGMPYYLHFTETYPTVFDLADATEDQVLKSWEGLGYYSRARNLHTAAKQICSEFNGKFPTKRIDIQKLKGVGPYTSAAIASFCYNEKVAVVDGNVYRVLSRFFDTKTPIDSTKGKKEFEDLAYQFLNKNNPSTHNQAIMELGALICYPSSPDCPNCPLNNSCLSAYTENWKHLPFKEKKIKVKNIYMDFFIIYNKDKVLIEKRKNSGIWKNLFQFPVIESENSFASNDISKWNIIATSDIMNHKLSHRNINARFHICQYNNESLDNALWINKIDINEYPFPRLILKYLDQNGI